MTWAPYLSLAASTVIALLRPDRQPGERLITLAVVAITVAWVYLLFTRLPEPRRAQRGRMLIYFVGLLALATLLMARNPMFFIFAISAFFHAGLLRPLPLIVAGVAATSILINTTITGFPWRTVDQWVLYGVVIVIQIIAIGGGSVLGEKLSELTEERRQNVARLEAAMAENLGLQRQLVAQAREAGMLDERARMAREIHDTIAHGLTGIVTQLEAAEHAEDRPESRQRHVANAIRLARDSLSEARRSVEASRPEILDGATLEEALSDVATRWSTLSGVPGRRHDHRRADAAPPRDRGSAAADRAGGPGERRQARHGVEGRLDVVLHGRRGDPRRARRRRRLRGTGRREAGAECGVRAHRDAPARRSRRGHPCDRVRAGRRHGHLGTGAGHRRPGGRVGVVSPIRLLIVDDHPVVRDGLRGMFEGDPEFEVLGEAADGAEAVERAESLRPDVVLMDLRMPRVDGATATRQLAERGNPARVLVLTTYETDSDVVPAIEAGAIGYLLKDSPRAELYRAVRAAHMGESVLAPSVARRLVKQLRTPAQDSLSERELEVLALIAQGETNRGTAARLFISEATVKTHLLHIYAKLDVNDRAAAVATAYERGLLGPGRG